MLIDCQSLRFRHAAWVFGVTFTCRPFLILSASARQHAFLPHAAQRCGNRTRCGGGCFQPLVLVPLFLKNLNCSLPHSTICISSFFFIFSSFTFIFVCGYRGPVCFLSCGAVGSAGTISVADSSLILRATQEKRIQPTGGESGRATAWVFVEEQGTLIHEGVELTARRKGVARMEIPGVFSDIPRWEYSSPIYGNPQPLVAAMPTAQAAPFALLQQQMAVWPPAAAPAAVALLPSAHIGSTSELITPLSATFPQCVMLVSPTQGTFDTSFPETVMAREFTTPPVQPVYGVVPTGDNFGAVSREFSAFLRGEHCSYSTGQCSPSGNVISKGDRVVSVRNFSCILGSSHEKDVVGDTAIPPLAQARPRPCHIPRHLLSSATSNSCFTTKTAMVGMASAC